MSNLTTPEDFQPMISCRLILAERFKFQVSQVAMLKTCPNITLAVE